MTTEQKIARIRRREFANWLATQKIREFSRQNGATCPIAAYLRRGGKVRWVSNRFVFETQEDFLGYAPKNPVLRLPKWAERFIEDWDMDDEDKSDSGAEALNTLRRISNER